MKKITKDLKLTHNIINAKIVFDKLTDEDKDTFSLYAAQQLIVWRYSPNLTNDSAVEQFKKFDIYKQMSLLSLVFLEKGIPTNNPEPHLNVWHVIEHPLVIPEKVYKLINDQLHYMAEKYNVNITI